MTMNVKNKQGELIDIVQNIFNDKWKIKIIWILLNNDKRFKDLDKEVSNLTQKTLIIKLKELEEKQLIQKECFPEVPPKVVYSATPIAKELKPIFKKMLHWVNIYKQTL